MTPSMADASKHVRNKKTGEKEGDLLLLGVLFLLILCRGGNEYYKLKYDKGKEVMNIRI